MNGSTWLSFIFSMGGSQRVGEDTCYKQKDKKTLEALANASAGRVPEKHQKTELLLEADSVSRVVGIPNCQDTIGNSGKVTLGITG